MNDKFMVRFIESLGHKQVFLIVWLGIGAFFSWVMYNFYRTSQRRNFRSESPTSSKPKTNLPAKKE